MKDNHILHLLCKYLLGGRVTLGERAFGQILTLSDRPSSLLLIRECYRFSMKDLLTAL